MTVFIYIATGVNGSLLMLQMSLFGAFLHEGLLR